MLLVLLLQVKKHDTAEARTPTNRCNKGKQLRMDSCLLYHLHHGTININPLSLTCKQTALPTTGMQLPISMASWQSQLMS